jgi:acetylglutamate kinase
MEPGRRHPAKADALKRKVKANRSIDAFSLPNIAELIEDGEITIGMRRPMGCVATAADADCTYVMLVRRRGESLMQFLIRLDRAIDKALTLGIFTDQINH